jgi:PAS domain-containing protein
MKEWRLRGIYPAGVVVDAPQSEAPAAGSAPHPAFPLDSVRAVFEQFPGLFWTTDIECRITSCLGRTLSSIGVGPNQLVGTEVTSLFELQDELVLEAHARALLGETVSFRLRLGGRNLLGRVAPISDGDGRTVGVIGVGVEAARIARSVGLAAAG